MRDRNRMYPAEDGFEMEEETEYDTMLDEEDVSQESEIFLSKHPGYLGLLVENITENYQYYSEDAHLISLVTFDLFTNQDIDGDQKNQVIVENGCVIFVYDKKYLTNIMYKIDPKLMIGNKTLRSCYIFM